LFDGKIELQYKVAYYDKTWNGARAYPSSGVNDFGKISKSDQKDVWCTYDESLFTWDLRNHSYDYRFKMIEDDGDGTGVTVKMGLIFSVVIAKVIELKQSPWTIEFKIANSDEEFNEEIIEYCDAAGEKTIGCKKGTAKIFLGQ